MILPPEPSGTSPMHNWLRRLRSFVQSLQIKPGQGYEIHPGTDGVRLSIFPGGAGGTGGTSIKQVEIIGYTTTNDWAVVQLSTYDEGTNAWVTSGSTMAAALPHLHRQATKPSSSHGDAVAVMWPAYSTNDVVLACQPSGGTGVEISGSDLSWMILPNKRAWCFEVPICAGGTTYYAIMPAWSMDTSSNGSFNPVD